MAFQRFEAGSGVSFLPWARDMETGLEVKYTTRDMPVHKYMMFVGRDDRLLFSFEVSYRHDDEKKQFIYSAPAEGLKVLYRKYMRDLPEFRSEEEFIARLREGVEIVFTDKLYAEHGSSVLLDLT